LGLWIFSPTLMSRFLPTDYAEKAHDFIKVSFHSPTCCSMCHSEITGLWKKGVKCKACGLVVGQGHDNCHAQAMLTLCEKKEQGESSVSCEKGMEDTKSIKYDAGKQKVLSSANKASMDRESSLGNIRRRSVYDRPHKFSFHTYGAPAYCSVCQGLLVGLWSQGLQCEVCCLNVHRGEGIDDHDDCKMEALLWPCAGEKMEEEHIMTLREAIKLSPHFIKDVTNQMGKDLHSQAKEIVVGAGVDEERSKKLRRLRKKIVAAVEALDAIEERGEIYSICILLGMHVLLAILTLLAGLLFFNIALRPKLGRGLRDSSIFQLALMNELTLFCSVRVYFMVLALVIRHYALLFMRKSIIIDCFLRDMFGIDAEDDLGISVAGAARRARSWSDRIVISTGITVCVAYLLWTFNQANVKYVQAMVQDYVGAEL